MRLLDISLPEPERNLALDESLLHHVDNGSADETLRFWESPVPFAVIGVSQAVQEQVYQPACDAAGVPILRRCSAGGCVLQGPGCLNYALVLSPVQRPEIETIRGSYGYILDRIAHAFQTHGVAVQHDGISDLALEGKKVSGSAQKRRRNAILHHGTLLYRHNPEALERLLREPVDAERPDYRGGRSHREFVRDLPFDATALRTIIMKAFDVQADPEAPKAEELALANQFVQEKYASAEWTFRK